MSHGQETLQTSQVDQDGRLLGAIERKIDRAFSRFALLDGPTPLHFARRLSEEVGVPIYVKRDDHGSLCMAGAKARKIERIVAQARGNGYSQLLTAGPAQSNTTRAIASACAIAGLTAELLLRAPVDAPLEGNALLAELSGATIERMGLRPWPELEAIMTERAKSTTHTFLVPLGGTNPCGVAGMMAGYIEMMRQLRAASVEAGRIYHASATGGVWAGLALGAALTGGPTPCPIAVIDDVYADMPRRYAEIFSETADTLEIALQMDAGDINLNYDWLGDYYGDPTDESIEAIRLMMRTEGILCDYVYSGKALAALIADARAGKLKGPAVLWHTGGLPGMMTAEAMHTLSGAPAKRAA